MDVVEFNQRLRRLAIQRYSYKAADFTLLSHGELAELNSSLNIEGGYALKRHLLGGRSYRRFSRERFLSRLLGTMANDYPDLLEVEKYLASSQVVYELIPGYCKMVLSTVSLSSNRDSNTDGYCVQTKEVQIRKGRSPPDPLPFSLEWFGQCITGY